MVSTLQISHELLLSVGVVDGVTDTGDDDRLVKLGHPGEVQGRSVVLAGVLVGAGTEGGLQVTGLGMPSSFSNIVVLGDPVIMFFVSKNEIATFTHHYDMFWGELNISS